MNDELKRCALRIRLLLTAGLAVWAGPVIAGEAVLYGPAPRWVEAAELPQDPTTAQLLFETQHRLEAGTVTSHVDTAVKILSPDAAMQQGTIALAWLPDKGDLTVHGVEILRGTQIVDVLDIAKFSVLRREQGLEQRLLDGELTATLAVPGLQVGDVLRVEYSISTADQALGSEMQLAQLLLPQPVKIAKGRTLVSWPVGEDIRWRAERGAPADTEVRDGYRWLEIKLPIAKAKEVPGDAPARFLRPAVLRAGSFADWQELSRTMHPHFEAAAKIAAGGALDAEVKRIMARTVDPLARAALALQLVQDDISYLLNGMSGGNYLPQAAEDTWTKRYGDCKAKSVLLLAMLRQMDIAAEPVLVASQGGDALPELLPLPADFDHMIVRAQIGGTDYWLDGTSAGTRLASIDQVPPFYHALPLTSAGSDLVPMVARIPRQPGMAMTVESDYSAGVDMPFGFKVALDLYGPQGASLRALAKSQDADQLRKIASAFYPDDLAGGAISKMSLSYDEAAGAARIVLEGVGLSEFDWDKSRMVLTPDGGKDVSGFNPDRARSEWHAIPVDAGQTELTRLTMNLRLPDGGKGYSLQGEPQYFANFATTRLSRDARLDKDRLHVTFEGQTLQGEIAPADVSEAKRAARRIAANTLKLIAPTDAKRRWEIDPAVLKRSAAKLGKIYDEAVAAAPSDDLRPLYSRAAFRAMVYDFDGALADYKRIAETQPTADLYLSRAQIYERMGRTADRIADLQRAYDLDADNETAFVLASSLAYAGDADRARDLLDGLAISEEQRAAFADTLATVTGLSGDTASALAGLADEVAAKPQDASLLNSDCWFRGLFKVALDQAMESCTRAVERSANSAAALDSRAMVRFRLGDYDAALTDLDAALALSPGQAASRYLRGIVRLAKGEAAGREDVKVALRMAPEIAAIYSRHGVAPPL